MKSLTTRLLGLLGAGAALLIPAFASAHVGYVLTHEEFVEHEGRDYAFLMQAFHEGKSAIVITAVIVLVLVAALVLFRKSTLGKAFMSRTIERLKGYEDLLPWIARLSLGIALIGAGTAGAIVSPVLMPAGALAFFEILLGFLFLLGFLTVPATLVSIGIFFFGAVHSGYLFGNLDFLVLLLSVFLLGSAKPGLDDLLGIPAGLRNAKAREWAPVVLRLGLGIAFLFLGLYEKILNPHDSALVVENFGLMHVLPVSPSVWVLGAGLVECVLGVLLIIGFEVRIVSLIAFLVISLSFFYFKESVYSHVTLFGTISMLVITGAGKLSLDRLSGKNRSH